MPSHPTFAVLASFALSVSLAASTIPRAADAQSRASTATTAGPNARLDSLAEAYYDSTLALQPLLASSIGDPRYNDRFSFNFEPDVRARSATLVAEYARQLAAVDRGALDEQHAITFDVFRRTLEDRRLEARFPGHLLPLNQLGSFASFFAQIGAGGSLHPFRTAKDYDDFLARIRGFERVVDVAITNMREGMARGVVPPRILIERTLPQLAAHVVEDSTRSVFWGPIAKMPASITPEDHVRLTAAYGAAIRTQIVPAYQRLHDFVRDQYLPRTRTTAGLGALPDGRAWYAERVRAMTTTDLTPQQIHELGLHEVARIHGEMEGVMRQVKWTGDLTSFLRHMATAPQFRYSSREEMLADYRATQARIDSTTDRLFDIRPAANYEIRPVEPFRERSAAEGSYQPASPDGTRPGIFYLNTYDPPSRFRTNKEVILVHEGSPGHHFQVSIARERTDLPRLRRFAGFVAYVEGWGLYAESLGPELGVYVDPYQRFGALSLELWRAIRLVLDTGIHEKGWTLDQAAEYARQNSSSSETWIRAEVERFAATPGQALAYKVGQLRISAMRRRAESSLGPRFDIKAFHRAVLEEGPLPLDMLDAKIDRWIAVQRGK